MSIMFLITGVVLFILVPVISPETFPENTGWFFIIMGFFFTFLLAYVTLSWAKMKIARVGFLERCKIVSWDTPKEYKKSKTIYVFSLLAGLILGTVLVFQRLNTTACILCALSLAFILAGWLNMAQSRYVAHLNSLDGFLLSHMGLICNGRVYFLNGTRKGIRDVIFRQGNLLLNVKLGKKELDISLPVPEDQTENVCNFIEDLAKYRKGEVNE